MKSNKDTKLAWSLNRAATEFGVSRETIRRGLRIAGIDSKRSFTTLEICHAIFGDYKTERMLKTREERKLLELERKQKEGDLTPTAEVQTLIRNCLLPARQRLLALPTECDTRCNPTDPKHARQQLDQWVREALPIIRDGLPKPMK